MLVEITSAKLKLTQSTLYLFVSNVFAKLHTLLYNVVGILSPTTGVVRGINPANNTLSSWWYPPAFIWAVIWLMSLSVTIVALGGPDGVGLIVASVCPQPNLLSRLLPDVSLCVG